jgi:pimeloyl-ACP methyl ester carboxylesterase
MAEALANFRSLAGLQEMGQWYARMLTRIDVPYEAITVATRFGATHLLAAGPHDAPPVVLLHGMEGTAISWRHQFSALAADYRLYALDIIGSAGKSAPIRLPHEGRSYGEWLADVLAGLGVRQASFVGMSNGCWLTIKFAEYAPEAITRAVMLSANGLMPVRFPYTMARLLERKSADILLGKVIAPMVTRDLVRRSITLAAPKGLPIDADEMEWNYLLAKHYRYRFPPPPLRSEQLRRLTAPTLLLMGEKEQFFSPLATLARARAHLPNLRVAKVIADVGHNMATDDPATVNGYIRAFLQTPERSGATSRGETA